MGTFFRRAKKMGGKTNLKTSLVMAVFLLAVLPGSVWAAGIQNALDFDGTDDRVKIPDDLSLDLTSAITIEAWINPAAYHNWDRIVAKPWASAQSPWNVWSLIFNNDPNAKGRFEISVGATQYSANSETEVPLNEWTHLAGSYDGETIRIFFNGVEEANNPSPSGDINTNNMDVYIGYNIYFSSELFEGVIDEVRIWNVALDETTIQNWMYREVENSHDNYANLVSYWKMNEGTGQTVADSKGSNDGTLGESSTSGMDDPTWVPSTRGQALCDYPPDGATIDDRTPALEWIPGVNADYHELYFSSNFNDVNDRNPAIKQIVADPCRPYPPVPPLQLGRTYYWLVDEVKSSPPGRWDARSVWSFTISEYLSLDDMEAYNDRGDIRRVWTDGYDNVVWGGTYPYLYLIQGGSSGSFLNVSTAVGSPYQGSTAPIHGGDQTMVLHYDNDGYTYTRLPGEEEWLYDAPYYSEIEANTVGPDSLDVGQNWSGEGFTKLTMWFQGHPISDGGYDAIAWPAYTVNGRGRDIWGRHDEFYYLSQYPFIGIGSIQSQVLGMNNTDPWAKAGVMIREKRAPYSKFAAVFITPGHGVTFQWRDATDGPCTEVTKPGVTAPQYVRLERTISGAFQASHSDYGIVWQDVNAPGEMPVYPNISMGTIDDPNLYAGSAVTSHNAYQLCSADFNNLLVSPLPSSWNLFNSGTNSPEQMYVALSDGLTTGVVNHPNPNAATLTEWQQWVIDLQDFSDAGVDLTDVRKMYIGFGDRDNPTYGGSGIVYFDDIRLYRPGPVFVDADAAGANDGTNWADAYNYLQDALAYANSNPDVNEIWVAQGTYKPDESTANPTGTDLRTDTFALINGVAIYGGLAGNEDPCTFDMADRDLVANETILSGDIGVADVNTDNSYHVVTGSGTEPNAIFDGFTITAGNADGSDPDDGGGGMHNDNGSPTLRNCTFSDNFADIWGGGMGNRNGSDPMLTNCTFRGNASVSSSGGGMTNAGSSPLLVNCIFIDNSANVGGGMANFSSSPKLVNCIFSGNSSDFDGGGMRNNFSSPTVINCTFSGNTAVTAGGGMYNRNGSDPTLTNCTFTGNSADFSGGGMQNWDSSNPTVTNCTFSGNSADNGGGMRNVNSSPTVTNCILWDNTDSGPTDESAQIYNNSSTPVVNYCCIQGWTGGLGGTGNIGDDPNFADPNGPDGIAGTEDDNLRLSWGSPCIDAGDNAAVPADILDLDNDGNTVEPIPFDLDGRPRIADGDCNSTEVVDMGAYEFNYAYVGDFDYDCGVDFGDFAILVLAWLTEPPDAQWNPFCDISIPADNKIDWWDLDIFTDNWLAGK